MPAKVITFSTLSIPANTWVKLLDFNPNRVGWGIAFWGSSGAYNFGFGASPPSVTPNVFSSSPAQPGVVFIKSKQPGFTAGPVWVYGTSVRTPNIWEDISDGIPE